MTASSLEPRPAPPALKRRNPAALIVLAVALVGAGGLLIAGLRSATLYYYNADEAVAKRAELGDDRFRIQGTVQDEVNEDGSNVLFDIAFGGVTVSVRHAGDPPELFRPGIPVVLEGRWVGDIFTSDRIMVKHSSEYREENPDRVPSDAP